ncbi:VapC toxin family PIN domain ribonuclease [Pseudonocardia sp. MH-G8]|uniref:VapC toxin family PIN domain ribonuclease n=1 Tax=Pseudonocardia sp. MH-G8 TaxID=1854588 RepID=UPI001303FA66
MLVAAFARWHADHRAAAAAVRRVEAVVDHVAVETFSVLTRLPQPRRVPPHLVTAFLDGHFPDSVPRLPSAPSPDVLDIAVRGGVSGGAVYDLVVALSAHRGGAVLLSLDRRAAGTYEAVGVAYELLA